MYFAFDTTTLLNNFSTDTHIVTLNGIPMNPNAIVSTVVPGDKIVGIPPIFYDELIRAIRVATNDANRTYLIDGKNTFILF